MKAKLTFATLRSPDVSPALPVHAGIPANTFADAITVLAIASEP
jgi:hypothetical protein